MLFEVKSFENPEVTLTNNSCDQLFRQPVETFAVSKAKATRGKFFSFNSVSGRAFIFLL